MRSMEAAEADTREPGNTPGKEDLLRAGAGDEGTCGATAVEASKSNGDVVVAPLPLG